MKTLVLLKRAFIAGLIIPSLFLIASCQTYQSLDASNHSNDRMPANAFEDSLSTNWLMAVRTVLPARLLAKKNPGFQEMTNSLCQESRRGNNAAQGLWGFTLLVFSHSPKDAETGLQLLRDSAEKGNVSALVQLGLLYEGGKYVRKNYNEAFHWFSLAADKGDPEAQLQLGGCYQYGLGTTPDFVMAAKSYRRSAEQTNYVAMKSLGYMLMNGLGMDKDLEAAKFWLTRAAKEGGNRRAMFNLGALCSMNFPDTNSMAEAFQWYKQSAELGDPLACYQLSNFYYRGWGAVETNPASYRYWRFRAASLGATEAQCEMGAAYRTGDGVPKNVETSLEWYRKAAAKNHPKAFYDLALHYLEDKTNRASLVMANNYMLLAAQAGHREAQYQYAKSCFRGDVAPVDFENGKQWLAKAAEAGWARAEFCLFQLYYNGVAPGRECPPYPKDKVEAVKWLRRAADHENFQAQSTLAIMLIRGVDVETDKPTAEKLLRNAAEHGYGQAQNDLGFAIENGDIGSIDMVESAMWCQLAESHLTDPNVLRRAQVNLSNALSRLTVDQQLEVDRRVKNFQALPIAETDPMPAGWEKNAYYEQEDGHFGH
jgi:TPR repeat protein